MMAEKPIFYGFPVQIGNNWQMVRFYGMQTASSTDSLPLSPFLTRITKDLEFTTSKHATMEKSR